MSPTTTAIVVSLAALTVFNLVMAVLVQRMLRRKPTPLLEDADAPFGMVILCLRGGDPFLERSLRRLFDQDYPNYRVRIMLDSANDSARRYVDAVLEDVRPNHVEVVSLSARFDTCSYKMSGILAATESLPPETAFVALMDGDTVPHRSWLRELASPIVKQGALCSTGNRWYFPEQPDLGSMVRVAWGAGALINMALARIPWGGTMAVRTDVITDERLRHRLRHAYSEDTTIGQFVDEQGGQVAFDPRLMIVNYEQIGLKSFFNFDTRQLLAARLAHRAWKWVVAYGLTGFPLLAYPLLRFSGFGLGTACDLAYGAYFLSYASQAFLFGPAIRKLLRGRDEPLPGWNLRRLAFGLLAVPTAQVLHLAALSRALTMRSVVWRGVSYRIGAKRSLKVVSDDASFELPTEPLARSA